MRHLAMLIGISFASLILGVAPAQAANPQVRSMTKRSRFMLSAIAAVTALCLSAGINPVPASATLLENSHQHVVRTVVPDEEVCGITVTTTLDIVDNFQVRLGQSGFALLRGIDVGTITWTNEANGQSVTQFFAGAGKDLSVTDNGDGTITDRYEVTGVLTRLTSSDGATTQYVGRIVFVDVVDYNGTPTDPGDDVVLSTSIESVSGSLPDIAFCDFVTAGLT
jgi:hypothetical protein